MTNLQISDELVEEIQQAFTEGEFNSRWALIECYHHVGTLINKVNTNRTELLQTLAQRVGRSVRSLWYASKFAEVFPILESLPEGKNVSFNQIKTKYLVDSTEQQKECLHPKDEIVTFTIIKCDECGKKLSSKVEKGNLDNSKLLS